MSRNPSKWAYKILKNNRNKIHWNIFSLNSYLFKTIKNNKYCKLFDSLLHEKTI